MLMDSSPRTSNSTVSNSTVRAVRLQLYTHCVHLQHPGDIVDPFRQFRQRRFRDRIQSRQFEIDRDLNAAINLEKLAVSFTDRVNACGGMSAGSDAEERPSETRPVKQEADIEQVRITPNRFE